MKLFGLAATALLATFTAASPIAARDDNLFIVFLQAPDTGTNGQYALPNDNKRHYVLPNGPATYFVLNYSGFTGSNSATCTFFDPAQKQVASYTFSEDDFISDRLATPVEVNYIECKVNA